MKTIAEIVRDEVRRHGTDSGGWGDPDAGDWQIDNMINAMSNAELLRRISAAIAESAGEKS